MPDKHVPSPAARRCKPYVKTRRWSDADKAALRAVVEEARGAHAAAGVHRLAMERLGLDSPLQAKGMIQRMGLALGRPARPRPGDHHRRAWALRREGKPWGAIPHLLGLPDISPATLRIAVTRYARAGLL